MAVVRTGGRIIGGPPGAIVGYEPLGGVEFGSGLGAWWKNSEIVSKLQLSEEQAKKISQTFVDHRLKLIDLRADVDKEELRLQPLLDLDQPDQSKVGAQIDLITAARGRLEKENAMMMLDIRRVLSIEQWKKLKSLEAAEPTTRNVFYYRGGPGNNIPSPLPLPPATTSSGTTSVPREVRNRITMGKFHMARGEYDQAIHSYEEGLRLDPLNQELQDLLDEAKKAREEAKGER